jgi:hypothetical protein
VTLSGRLVQNAGHQVAERIEVGTLPGPLYRSGELNGRLVREGVLDPFGHVQAQLCVLDTVESDDRRCGA